MTPEERNRILKLLDAERQTVIHPGTTHVLEMGLVRDISDDGKTSNILFSGCSDEELDRTIQYQIENARSHQYNLEWKWYEHDRPPCLSEHLVKAGLKAGEMEAFMVLAANQEALDRFGPCPADIRRVTTWEGLRDVQLVSEEVQGKSDASRIKQWAQVLDRDPASLCIYVAYVEGEPAASGRLHCPESSRFAGLYGGQTRERFRKRGLFTQLVAVRIREALRRGIPLICVDALPTSEPILSKRGFETVTYTRPFCFSGIESGVRDSVSRHDAEETTRV